MIELARISEISFSLKPLLMLGALIFLAYAEIHFRYPHLPSLIFRKEPEILFDLPLRSLHGEEVLLFLLVKDADRFPVTLIDGTVSVSADATGALRTFDFSLNQSVQNHFFAHTLKLPPDLFPHSGKYRLTVRLRYQTGNGKIRELEQDNYPLPKREPFLIYLSEEPLPTFPGWYWGDLHVHSNFTEDQVEFGAPIRETVLAARNMGLHFVAITDHSYDLDDLPNDYTRNDPQLRKWHQFRQEIEQIQREFPDFVIIPGEEVSVGNHRGQNVHCLVLNDPQFHPGSGDGAEHLLRNRPTMSLDELFRRKHPDALIIAAHPVEKPPLSQQKILNRGIWELPDVENHPLNALQILNGMFRHDSFFCGLAQWKILLHSGRKIGIVAGNDAHGNFNIFRQVKTPFLTLHSHRQHLLGKMRTAVFSENLSLPAVLTALKKNRSVISDGPLAILTVQGERSATIGEQIHWPGHGAIRIRAKSTAEYGFWRKIVLYLGDRKTALEHHLELEIDKNSLEIEREISLPDSPVRYIRLEGSTIRNSEKHYCYTNPIWFHTDE